MSASTCYSSLFEVGTQRGQIQNKEMYLKKEKEMKRQQMGEGQSEPANGAVRFMAVWRWDGWLFDQWAAENGRAALYGPGEKMRRLSHTYPSESFSGSFGAHKWFCVCLCGRLCVCVCVWSCGRVDIRLLQPLCLNGYLRALSWRV